MIRNAIIKNCFKFVEGIDWKTYKNSFDIDNLSEKELNDYKFKKLKKIIKHAYNNIPLYRELYDKNKVHPDDLKSFNDLEKFPIITKADLKKNFPKNILGKKKIKGLLFDATSGTTGTPFKFINDRKGLGLKKAITYKCWNWLGYNLGDRYVRCWALLDESNKGNFKNRLYRNYSDLVYNRYQIGANAFSDPKKIPYYLNKIIKYNPKLIVGLISPLTIIADYVSKNKINFPKIPLSLYGETLTKERRNIIEQNLSPYVYNAYGLGESRAVAFECKKKEGLHITETAHVEIIKNNKLVGTGKKGKIILTDLDNYIMPLIRYDTKDIGIKSTKKCSCGRPYEMLEHVYGRESEHIVSPSGKILGLNHFTQLIGHDYNIIEKWQVEQKKKNELIVRIVPTKKFSKGNETKLKKKIAKYIGSDVEIEIIKVNKILPTRQGKYKLVISKISKW